MSRDHEGLARVARLAGRTERRMRGARALGLASRALCVALGAAIVAVVMRKLGFASDRPVRVVLEVSTGAVGLAAATGWLWRLPERAGARALDRTHSLHDRLTSALEFGSIPVAERTPFMQAAIDDAIAAAPLARPQAAAPIRIPPGLVPAVGLAALLVAASLVPTRAHAPVAVVPTIDPLEMSADDIDDARSFLQQLGQRAVSDDTRTAIEQFNKLVEDIASKRLDRTETFRRIESLDEELAAGATADRKALKGRLEAMGEAMTKAELTRPAGLALSEDHLAQARDALQDLAKKLRGPSPPVDKAKLDETREALKRAAEQADKARSALDQRRQQLSDEILKMKQKNGDAGSDEEQSLLRKKERELERLDRESEAERSAANQLDRLDRELEQAAEDLMKDLGLSAGDLEQGAEDINHLDQQQMSQEEKEQLRQKLQEMRQLLREQGQGGKGQMVRLQRFGRMARGQGPGQGQRSGQQGEGQGQPGSGSPSASGQGQGASPGQGPGGANGQPAQGGQGSQAGETWIVGPNGERMLMLSRGASGEGHGSESGGAQGEGAGRSGEGHDPHLLGKATHPGMGSQDTQVQGADNAQGGSRSEVILGAAERGFASHRYQKVYAEYHQVAEESLAKDEIPGGYRFYVKRYFQLIRPRDTP